MSSEEQWKEFLSKATAQEVFSKIGKTITFNESIPADKRQAMSEKLWGLWGEYQKTKQKTIFEDATDSDWWNI